VAEEVPGVPGDFAVGAQIASYRLAEQIGWGGMAVVYRALDVRLDRWVALKILAPEMARDASFRQRFISESRAAAAVDHPHIIPVFEAGEASGVLFIAMRYVGGGDVRTLFRRLGPLNAARTTSIIGQVASALDAAHAAGLVHRDVKPANMLLGALASSDHPDHVYLSDFGLSKQALATAGLTQTGQFVGTLDYMAPEQIESRPVDGRTDLYSLACAAYELLCGEPPFRRGENLGLLFAQLSAPPPPLTARRPDLPPAVDLVLARALARSPGDRQHSCHDFAASLRAACGLEWGESGRLRPGPPRAATALAGPIRDNGPPPARGGTDGAAWPAASQPPRGPSARPSGPAAGPPGPSARPPGPSARPPGPSAWPPGPSAGPPGPSAWPPGPSGPDPRVPGPPTGRPASAGWAARPEAGPTAVEPGIGSPGWGPSGGGQHPGGQLPYGQASYEQASYEQAPPEQATHGYRPGGPGSSGPGSVQPYLPPVPSSLPQPRGRSRGRPLATAVIVAVIILGLAGGLFAYLRHNGAGQGRPSPTVAASPGGQANATSPAATVKAYIAAINSHDYARAWRLGGRNSTSSFSSFKQGFSTTAKDSLNIESVTGNVVTGRLSALQSDGTVRTYHGTYTVQNGVITKFNVRQTG